MSTHQLSKSAFKAKALEYFRHIEASGESVIVTDHGKPALEVRPYHPIERGPLEVLRGSVVYYEDPTGPGAEDEWEALQ
jgi:antitoxin (DNA-binding transcriptional repressor) of toxin-antitoxin stability system